MDFEVLKEEVKMHVLDKGVNCIFFRLGTEKYPASETAINNFRAAVKPLMEDLNITAIVTSSAVHIESSVNHGDEIEKFMTELKQQVDRLEAKLQSTADGMVNMIENVATQLQKDHERILALEVRLDAIALRNKKIGRVSHD